MRPSYNDLDGSPVSGSHDLLTGLLRDEYDFTGLVISDLEAVPQLHTKHRTSENVVAAYAQAFTAAWTSISPTATPPTRSSGPSRRGSITMRPSTAPSPRC